MGGRNRRGTLTRRERAAVRRTTTWAVAFGVPGAYLWWHVQGEPGVGVLVLAGAVFCLAVRAALVHGPYTEG